jgi:hypothetical protein
MRENKFNWSHNYVRGLESKKPAKEAAYLLIAEIRFVF